MEQIRELAGLTGYDLIAILKKQGIHLYKKGDKLSYKGSKELISNELLTILKERKTELLDYLRFLEQSELEEKLMLTPIQQAYLIGGRSDCELGGVNAHYYVEYEAADIDVAVLEQAVNETIKKHDGLRTIIYQEGYQRVLNDVPHYSIRSTESDSQSQREQVRAKLKRNRYELEQWPMFEFQVSKNRTENDVLHISFDCIILDAWSAKKMTDEVMLLYHHKSVCYSEYSFKAYLKTLALDDARSGFDQADRFWEEAVKTMPPAPSLNLKKPLNQVSKPQFERVEHSFTVDETILLYNTLKKYHLTPAVVICTVFLNVLSRYSSNQDLTINLTLFSRLPLDPEVEAILGEFTNIGLISFINDQESFLAGAKAVQKQFFKLLQYRTYDGTNILKKLSRGNPGMAVMPVVYTSMLSGDLSGGQQHGFCEAYSLSQTPQVFLDHHARDDLGTLKLSWDYVSQLFEREQLEQIFVEYISMVQVLINCKNWEKINRLSWEEENDGKHKQT